MAAPHNSYPDFSPRTIKLGEKLQALRNVPGLGRTYDAVHDWWAGSDSSAYRPVRWFPVDLVPFEYDPVPTPVIGAGNPEAGRRPRTYTKALVVGAGWNALQELRQECGADGAEAIGYVHKGQAHAAILPEGLGSIDAPDEDTWMMAALREGKKPAEAAVGIVYPPQPWQKLPRLIIPQQERIEDLVPTANIAQLYPNVPLV